MPSPQASFPAVLSFCLALCLCAPFTTQAQGVPCNGEESNGNFSLSVELFAEDIGPLTDLNGTVTDLSGYNTYRIFVNTEGPLDKLSAVYGDDLRPLSITSTQPFHQTTLFPGIANALVNVSNPLLFPSFPEAEFDSWLTIGIDQAHNASAGETAIALVEDPLAEFATTFANGGNVTINTATGGAWYIDDADLYINGDAGTEQKVLVAQLTTEGQVSGDLAMQIFRDGEANSENCIRPYLSFQSHGCMDATACNYAPTAIIDDGTCDFCSCPDSVQILTASFPSDSIPTYSLEVELIADHDTTGITTNFSGTPDPLAGMKTYRLYAKVDNPATKVGAGYGNTTEPLNISSSTSFYQAVLGAETPSNISPTLFPIPTYADLEYDTWVTINIDRSPNFLPAGFEAVSIIEVPGTGGWAAFESGGALIADDEFGRSWFMSNPESANVFPDADLRVLIGQFTTDGIVSGTLGLQIVPFNATLGDDYRLPFSFTTAGLGDYVDVFPDICTCDNVDGDYLCDDEDNCTDLTACNFSDPANGTCLFLDECGVCGGTGIPAGDCDCDGNQLDALNVCGGTCAADVDGNGTCDDSEILGCMDPTADNYDPTATQDDGGCEYLGCTDPTAQNYDADANVDDGSCEFPGCIDPEAWNYDPSANVDDGSCQANACGVDGVLVVATNFAYTPSAVSIPTGGTVVWQNESTSLHNVNGDISTITGESFGNPVAFGLPNTFGDLNGTCIGSVTFTVPGLYEYDCSIGAHASFGMVGTISVGTPGCTDATATNYDAAAEYDDGSCSFAGCTDAAACNYDANANTDDGTCVYVDGICETCEDGLIVDNDADNDGVCDANEVTGCTDPTACNYDSDPTTDTDNTLCTYVDGICETCENGLIVDNDQDNDGVCDANEVTGCTDPTACNYDSDPTTDTDNTLCTYVDGICETCENGLIVDNDADNDGVCDANEVTGCTDPTACNYDSDPTTDTDNTLCTYVDGICETCENGLIVDNDQDNDGVCDADEVEGCTDPTACNYDSDPTTDTDNTLCTYVDGVCETCENGLIVDNDADDDGVCNADEVEGCTDPTACNYDSNPTTDTDNTLCTYVDGICETCENGLIVDNDTDNDGVCDAAEIPGCQDAAACNYNASATDSDGSCVFVDGVCETCSGETDGTGSIVDNDADNDGVCDANEVEGCTDPTACNYDSDPTTDTDNTLCTYVDGICETCENGLIVDNDADDDGVCNADEVEGCTDPTACNYDADPTTDTDNTLCTYVDGICETCEGGLIVDNDQDNDGVCDANEVTGCTDATACNYDSNPTTDTDNTLCTYVDGICETCEGGLIVDNDQDNDGVCDANEMTGCTDATACNYDSNPTTDTDNTLCTYVDGICETCENGLIVDNDQDNDGVCDANEVTGCTDPTACNYDSDPTTDTDNTLCTYVDGICETCEGGLIVDNDQDNDGVCDANEVTGCTDPTACNYDATPTTDTDNTLCTYVDGICETCEGGLIVDNDADDDGVCNADEVEGCTDPTACNYDDDPTTDTNNLLCVYATGCETCSGQTDGSGTIVDNDADDDGVCDADEVQGCTDASACNYDADPTTDTDNTLCLYPTGCETCSGQTNGTGTVVDNDADNDGVCDANEVTGCTDPTACNFDGDPTTDTNNLLCVYATGCETCSGQTDGSGTIVDNDADDDGVCDADELEGCTDETACNYDTDPTTDTDNTLCLYPTGCETCSGQTNGTGTVVDNDADDDGVCDADEVTGCTDATACNFDSDPTTDSNNLLCVYATGCETCSGQTDGSGTVVDNDADDDGVCDADELEGCTDETACNYDADPTTDTDNTLCLYPTGCETCSGQTNGTGTVVDNDADDDGVCDADEVTGCTDATACNYDSDPTTDTDNTLCTYVDGICESCVNGTIVDNDADNDGVCDADETAGCTDPNACNAGPFTDTDNSLCVYADDPCESCQGGAVILSDVDGDGICNADEIPGCQDISACNYNSAATDSDGSCLFASGPCDTCSGETDGTGSVVDNDADDDGVCDADELDGCTDSSACNYDATPTTDTDNTLCIYPTGCESCSGQTDGSGTAVDNDADDDGVCDANELTGCTDSSACNYDATPTIDTDNTLCIYPTGCESCSGQTDGSGTVVDNDADDDGVCDANEVTGCTDPAACNYDSDPTTDTNNLLCSYATGCETCSGETDGTGTVVDNDADDDGVCDADEVEGCTDASACNYDADPTTDTDNMLCIYPTGCETCSGQTNGTGTVVDNDQDNDGVCDADEATGCTDPTACNYDADPTTDTDNLLCVYATGCETCSGETDGTGTVIDNDADNDGVCDADEVERCTDPTACNYDSDPTTDTNNTLCTYVDGICETCEGGLVVDNDADDDGVCDADEVTGCTDATACNYDSDPTTDTDNTLCTYVDGVCETCENGLIVDNDQDNDGVCDANETAGCTDPAACNAGSFTDTDNSLCVYADDPCESCLDGAVILNDADGDGICDADEIPGCQDISACNYNSAATDSDGSCLFASGPCDTCSGETDGTGTVIDNDADNDGVCDADEVEGCTDPTACNYDADPTTDTDNALCTYVDGICETCEDGLIVDNDADNDGVCDANEVTGCTDPTACNYDSDPTTDTDNTLCTYVDGVCETCVNGLIVDNDADDDGVCDANETAGCTDPAACNAGSFTDTDNSLCVYADDPCESCLDGAVILNDADGDGVCDQDEIPGCTDNAACNYNAAATDEDSSCLELDECGICGGNGIPAGDCDCNGNQLDALGVCGGDCATDADGDGICDDVDFCVGVFDACGVCNGPGEVYECGCADIPAGDCDCNGNQLDALGVCGGSCTADADGDGICDDVDDCVGALDACGVCNGPGEVYECGCADIPAGDCDCNGNQLDALGVCGGSCTADADGDGICDDVDDCVGALDACGVCNGPGEVYECGCADIPAGDCDCNGNQLDALGVCGGDCAADADGDGICDDVDDCVGALDACGVCNGPGEVYECGCADIPAGDCDCNGNQLDALGICGGDCAADADGDGICDDVDDCVGALDACGVCNGPGEVYECGCADIPAGDCDCNGNQLDALGVCGGDCVSDTDGDGICDTDEIGGCTDEAACNFDPTATDDDGTCTYAGPILDCNGDCINDSDGDGICDENENECPDYNGNGICDNLDVFGCTYPDACNFDPAATADDGSCTYAASGFNCDGTSIDGSDSFAGCTYPQALNYSGAATVDDGSCVFVGILDEVGPCLFDVSNDGIVNTPDLLIFLQYWEGTCE